ncbi:MAG: hypothetical protein AAGA63_08590 [Pseudomonadota bacterium]
MNAIIRSVLGVTALSILVSCSAIKAFTYQHDTARTGISTPQNVSLIYSGASTSTTLDANSRLELPAELERLLNTTGDARLHLQQCGYHAPEQETASSPELVPLAVAGAQLIFGFATDALAARLEELRRAATRTYGAKVIVDGPVLSGDWRQSESVPLWSECLVLLRENLPSEGDAEAPSSTGFALVLTVARHADAVSLVPQFLWVENSLAISGNENDDFPSVSFSIAATIQSAQRNPQTGNEIKQIGQSTFTFRNLKVGTGSALINCRAESYDSSLPDDSRPECKLETSIIARPEPGTNGSQFSIAVTEVGTPASVIDPAQAELKALREALGPAIGKAIEIELSSP